MRIINHSFKHTRSASTLEGRSNLSATEEFNGELMVIQAPFGIDIYIHLYDGENRYLVSGTGGHSSNFILVEMQVDSQQKVLGQYNSREVYATSGGYHDAIRFKLQHELPKEVYELIKKYFAAPDKG